MKLVFTILLCLYVGVSSAALVMMITSQMIEDRAAGYKCTYFDVKMDDDMIIHPWDHKKMKKTVDTTF